MENVLTLIAGRWDAPLQTLQVDLARAALDEAGAETLAPDWLCPGVACDIAYEGIEADEGEAAVRQYLIDLPIDIASQALAGRQKKLLVADMDSTIIAQECIVEIAEFAGKRAEVARITDLAMRGELDFEAALRERAKMLAGLGFELLHEAWEQRISLTPGAQILVQVMRASGAYTALVSGGFNYFTRAVARRVGFDVHQANELEIKDGQITGRVLDPVAGAVAKRLTLERLCRELGIESSDCLALGDGANDIPMIQAAGQGVAYHAQPLVAAAAHTRIDNGDLTAALYLQGYRRDDLAPYLD